MGYWQSGLAALRSFQRVDPAHNIRLSTDRARSVAEYLIESNVPEDRITYEGLGSSKPVASNETDGGRRKNRRVEILLTD